MSYIMFTLNRPHSNMPDDSSDLPYQFQDMVHVAESKPAKRHGDYFLRQIVKVWTPEN